MKSRKTHAEPAKLSTKRNPADASRLHCIRTDQNYNTRYSTDYSSDHLRSYRPDNHHSGCSWNEGKHSNSTGLTHLTR